MCWHVRERVLHRRANKGGTAGLTPVLYLKGQVFFIAAQNGGESRAYLEGEARRFLIREVRAGKPDAREGQ